VQPKDPVVQALEDKVPLEAQHGLLVLVRGERPALWQLVEDDAEAGVEVGDRLGRIVLCEDSAVENGAGLASCRDADTVGGRVGQDCRRSGSESRL
jgi:hypothetical protein